LPTWHRLWRNWMHVTPNVTPPLKANSIPNH
jgi:hypothetical protein